MIEKAWALQIVDAVGTKQLLIGMLFSDWRRWTAEYSDEPINTKLFKTRKKAQEAKKTCLYSDAKVVRVQVEVKVI